MKYALLILCVLAASCASRTEEQGKRANDVRIAGNLTIPMPQADGSVKPVTIPLDITIVEDETTTKNSETKSGVDMAQVQTVINSSIKAAMAVYMPQSAGSSFLSSESVSMTLNGIMTAIMGYLALAKRNQMAELKKGKA